jgi:hypothetical protein
MIEKLIKNKWFLLLIFLIVAALTLGAATLSLVIMNKHSTLLFACGGIMLFMTIVVFAFWSYMIFNQVVLLLREEKLVKKSKNKKDE